MMITQTTWIINYNDSNGNGSNICKDKFKLKPRSLISDGKIADVLLDDYHHYDELMSELASLADNYPGLVERYEVGKTVQVRKWVRRIQIVLYLT